MTTTRRADAKAHAAVVDAAWEGFVGSDRLTGVLSPPGAGKSTLVRAVAVRWTSDDRPQLPVVTQTNSQADDLCADLAADAGATGCVVGRLHGQDYTADPRLRANGVVCATNIAALAHCDVVIAPARKWAFVDGVWEAAIIDEVFQMRSDQLLPLGHRFRRLLVVGDPGQLNPFTTGPAELFRGRPSNPIESAAVVLIAAGLGGDWLTLPVSWRLRPDAATVISESFYLTPFDSGVPSGARQLHVGPGRPTCLADRVHEIVAASGWALVELPEAHLPRSDPEAVEVITDVVASVAGAGLTYSDESHTRSPLGAGDIAVAVAHRDQRGHLRANLDRTLAGRGLPPGSVVVDTASRLQGRQFQLVVAWHPLSGRRDASAFHLEAGRLCVMLSRHRLGCIVVAREGIREQLESHPATEPIWTGEAPPAVDGWEANLTVLDRLNGCRIAA